MELVVGQTYNAVVTKAIIWDNCEGSTEVMARVGDVINVTVHGESYSARFGDVSDFVERDQFRIVTPTEAVTARATRAKQLAEQRTRRTLEEEDPLDPYGDDPDHDLCNDD